MPFKKLRQGAVARGEVSVPRLFYCTVAGLVIAIVLSFLFGASGLSNYHELRAYQAHVSDGIVALQDRHRSLQQRVAVLRDNPEALRLLARENGYFRPGETVIEVGPAPVDPTAAAGARSGSELAGVAPLLQRTPPAPREPFNALALGLCLGAGSFAMLSMLRGFRRRAHAGTAPGRGDLPHPRSAADPAPSRPSAAGESHAQKDDAAPAKADAGGEAAAEPAGRRRRARRRRRDVTVYRL